MSKLKWSFEKVGKDWIAYENGKPEYKFENKERASQFCRSLNRVKSSK